jgi:hypothetical protein
MRPHNRRLVPMRARKAPAPLSTSNASTAAPVPPMQTWHCFAWLIVTAVALYYAKWPILIITGLIGFFRG